MKKQKWCFIDSKQEYCNNQFCAWAGFCKEINEIKKRVKLLENKNKHDNLISD